MITITITSVEGVVLDTENISQVTIPTVSGIITVLSGHVPLISVLGMGEMLIKYADDRGESALFVDGGTLLVDSQESKTHIEVVANLAERAESLEAAQIEEAKRKAERLLTEHPAHIDFAKVELSLQREIAKLKIVKKKKSHN